MAKGDIEMKLRIPADIARKLEAARKADDRTRHGMVVMILRRWLMRRNGGAGRSAV